MNEPRVPNDATVPAQPHIPEAARLTHDEIFVAARTALQALGELETVRPSVKAIYDMIGQAADAATAKALRWGILGFARAILHGDDVHRTWLLAAAEQYIQDGTVPTVQGGSNQERIAALQEQVWVLREALQDAHDCLYAP